MLIEKFFEVINDEGVASIVSWGKNEPNIVNTWNSYITATSDERLLIPAAGMRSIEEDLKENNKVKLTVGSRNVQGLFMLSAGFKIEGTAKFLESGEDFEMMKAKFPFLSRVLEITVVTSTQTL